MNVENRKIPEHEAIYERLRDAVLFGELVPGQAVTLQGLSEHVGAGMTPVREAIRRLTSEGALRVLENRRVEVPYLTGMQVQELAFARNAIEPELASLAAKNMDEVSLNSLVQIDLRLNDAIAAGSIEGYLVHNYRFHFGLYALANARILFDLAHSLWLRSGPSLRVVCGRFGTANLPDMHREAIEALKVGDPDAVKAAIAADIGQGMDVITRALPESAQRKVID